MTAQTMRPARLDRTYAVLGPVAQPGLTSMLAAANAATFRLSGRGPPAYISGTTIFVCRQHGYAPKQLTATSLKPSTSIRLDSQQARKLIRSTNKSNSIHKLEPSVPAMNATQDLETNKPMEDERKRPEGEDEGQKKEQQPKRKPIKQKIKEDAQHYWDGTKLLATEVKISSKLALKMTAGYELGRREHRQLKRTVKDLGRLVPFSVFVIVPFAEVLLPLALRIFPNLLPSSYEGKSAREKRVSNLKVTQKEVSAFLKATLRETGLPVTGATVKNEEFAEFFKKVRNTGEAPSTQDVIKVCKIFKDDLTLDNLSRPQLVATCKYMDLNSFGTDAMLRYNLRQRMRQIKRDDRVVSDEGVESLSAPELQMACISRGIRTHAVPTTRLREKMSMWLDLRLKQGIPSILLILGNAYLYSQGTKEAPMFSQVEALQFVLSSVPEELLREIKLESYSTGHDATNKQRLKLVKRQQELIEGEHEQESENEKEDAMTRKDTEDMDDHYDKKSETGYQKQSNEAIEASKDSKWVEGLQTTPFQNKKK